MLETSYLTSYPVQCRKASMPLSPLHRLNPKAKEVRLAGGELGERWQGWVAWLWACYSTTGPPNLLGSLGYVLTFLGLFCLSKCGVGE